jgi:hypothetical protein
MVLIIPRLQQGFTLLEGLLGLSVLMGLLVLGSHHTQGRLEEQLCQSTAAHLRIVTKAAERYVLDQHGPEGAAAEQQRWQEEQQQLPEDKRHSLEKWRYQQLIDKKYLTEDFKNGNLYGQCYSITVKPQAAPQPHKQLLILTTGDRIIKERSLRQIARQLGRQGGYISSTERDRHDDFCITGSQRGWTLPLLPETLYQSSDGTEQAERAPVYPMPGHLASLSLLYDDELLQGKTLLHRMANPDQPQLNQMETDLVMQEHQVVFYNGQHLGKINAKELELIAKQSGSGPYDQGEKLTMNPEKITFTGNSVPEQWHHQVKNYSPPELHRYWNKLPYYELSKGIGNSGTQQFADEVCATAAPNQMEKFSTIGRLFMLGFEGHLENRLYLCGHAPRNHSVSSITGFFIPEAKAQLINTINHSYLQNIANFSKLKVDVIKDKIQSTCGVTLTEEQIADILKALDPNGS